MTLADMHLQIAAVGWDHEHWHEDFYPPDLPPDWRLSYYANEFREVLVPASVWLREHTPDLRQWDEDTAHEFRFYIHVTATLLSRLDWSTVIQRLLSLDEKLGGIVMDRRSAAFGQFAQALNGVYPEAEIFEDAGELVEGSLRCWRGVEGNLIGRLNGICNTDLKRLRTHIERFVETTETESGVIFIEGDIKVVQDATVIARLLGY